MKLIDILESLKQRPRKLNNEENLYINRLKDELRLAASDSARWHILEREGLTVIDGFNFSDDVIARLTEARKSSLH